MIQCALASLMGNSHEFHNMSLFLWQWGVNCAVLPYICEYLNITPGEFFDAENKNPEKIQEVVENLKKLDSEQLDNISAIIRDLAK